MKGGILLLGLVVMVVVVSAAPPPTPPTNLPKAFSDMNMTTANGFTAFAAPAQFWYDENQVGQRVSLDFALFSGYPQNVTSVTRNATTYIIQNELCRTLAQPFAGLFSWLPVAHFNGEVVVDGRLCNEFVFNIPGKGPIILDVLTNRIDGYDIPVRLIAPGSSLNGRVMNNTLTWSTELTIGPVDPSVWEITSDTWTCATEVICPDGPAFAQENVYLFHDANYFVLNNTNVADQLGDVAFVCLDMETNLFEDFQWVSGYVIEWNTTWGEYSYCNYGTCWGGSVDRVGREGSEGVGYLTGQCTNNSNTGSWYALPPYSEELCPEYANGTIGINGTVWYGCGWNIIKKIKTINSTCLRDNGFLNACRADGDFPFPTASKIWEQAFASEDPSNGGCPDIYPYQTGDALRQVPEQEQRSRQLKGKAFGLLEELHDALAALQPHLEANLEQEKNVSIEIA